MVETFLKATSPEEPLLDEGAPRIRTHLEALLIATIAATITMSAINAPLKTAILLGGLLSIAMTWLMRRWAWILLCYLSIPAVAAGEFGRFETGGGTLIAPSLIVVAVWALGFFLAMLLERGKSFRRLPLIGPFAVFWLAIALSLINAVSVLHWARGLLEAILGFAFFAYGQVYLKDRRQLVACLRILVWLAVFTVVFGVLQHALFDSLEGLFALLYSKSEIPFIEMWHSQGRMVANWVHPSDFGSLLNIAAPIALYYYLSAKEKRLVPFLLFLAIAAGILLTATRTPIIAFCLSSAVLCFLMRARKIGVFIMSSAVLLLVVGPSLFSLTSQRFNFSDEGNLGTVDERKLLWFEAASFFVQHPVVGIGARNFTDQVEAVPDMPVHNAYLEAATETGTIGLLAFLYLLYRAFRVDFSARKICLPRDVQNLKHALFCSSLAIAVESLTDNDFYVWQVWCLFWLVRGFSAAIVARPERFISEP